MQCNGQVAKRKRKVGRADRYRKRRRGGLGEPPRIKVAGRGKALCRSGFRGAGAPQCVILTAERGNDQRTKENGVRRRRSCSNQTEVGLEGVADTHDETVVTLIRVTNKGSIFEFVSITTVRCIARVLSLSKRW